MKPLFETASELQKVFVSHEWEFCFIGGIALQRWGQPRLTRDVDITIFCGFGNERLFIEDLLGRYKSRIDEPARFALKNRVLLLVSDDGVGIDIALGGLPFEKEMISRASDFEFLPGFKIKTCSAEDLIIMKAFADRSQDWADVENVVKKQVGKIDRKYVYDNLKPLCELKESPEIITRLKKLLPE